MLKMHLGFGKRRRLLPKEYILNYNLQIAIHRRQNRAVRPVGPLPRPVPRVPPLGEDHDQPLVPAKDHDGKK